MWVISDDGSSLQDIVEKQVHRVQDEGDENAAVWSIENDVLQLSVSVVVVLEWEVHWISSTNLAIIEAEWLRPFGLVLFVVFLGLIALLVAILRV